MIPVAQGQQQLPLFLGLRVVGGSGECETVFVVPGRLVPAVLRLSLFGGEF